MEIKIRQARMEDAHFLNSLSVELGYDMPVAKTREMLDLTLKDPRQVIFVAAAGDQVVGWIHGFITARLESGLFCEIGGLVVSQQHRNRGTGKLLIHQIKSWCDRKQIQVLKVRCNSKRAEAHQFYLGEGFRELKQQKVFEILIERST